MPHEEQAAESVLAHQHLSAAALRELPELARRYSVEPSAVAHLERDINDRIAGGTDTARRSRVTHQLEMALCCCSAGCPSANPSPTTVRS